MSIAPLLLGQEKASVLMTDGYKFSMAQAGFPLREETFYLTLRKGGPFYIPFDLVEVVQGLLPSRPTGKEAACLTANGYGLTPAMEAALGDGSQLKIWAAPQHSWVTAREPILTITGPSFLVSWLEPLAIMLHYPIQIATALLDGKREFRVTCSDEAAIIREVQEELNLEGVVILVQEDIYKNGVKSQADRVVDVLRGQAYRAFEVGLRAATCMQQHLMALEACRAAGINKTSNVYGAWKHYMIPVGTTGHEHQQRWGRDEDGFRAIRDMRPEPPSYLFDTYNPMKIGIPAALKIIREDPDRPCSLRFDSGNQDEQLRLILKGLHGYGHLKTPVNLIFEDGYTADKTAMNECGLEGLWPVERRLYGYGGYLVSAPSPSEFNRDAVSAAYKLCETGGRPVMKFSGTPGKESLPGRPVILRSAPSGALIAQEGEAVPNYLPLDKYCGERATTGFSPQTQALIDRLTVDRVAAEHEQA